MLLTSFRGVEFSESAHSLYTLGPAAWNRLPSAAYITYQTLRLVGNTSKHNVLLVFVADNVRHAP